MEEAMEDLTPGRQRTDALFTAALEEPPERRRAFLDDACGDDRALLERLLRMVAAADAPEAELRTGGAAPGELLARLAAEEETADDVLPIAIGPYRVLREIGRGGMAIVYLAERASVDFRQRVAVKVMQFGSSAGAVQKRFSQERSILASLNHAAIARLLDGGSTDDGRPFFAMELVEGEPIDLYCESHGLSLAQRLRLFLAVAEAVQYAHRKLVVHRDLKPSNIMVGHDGRVKLLDFGIAKLLDPSAQPESLTSAWALPMTPQCASPEQVRGEPVTTAADIYQLGLLLYRLLTGRYPYRVEPNDRNSLAKAICEQEPTRPSIVTGTEQAGDPRPVSAVRAAGRRLRGDLDAIVLMALRKEPERRYASVEQFSEDVRRYLDGRPVAARADTLGYRAGKFLRRHKAGIAAAGLVFAALAGGLAAATYQAQRAERRFQQVRDLANTLMFDFHDKIQYLPGSTEARGLLVDTALRYLDGLAADAGGDESLLAELAVAYQRVGDVQGDPRGASLGRTAEAMVSYRKSLDIARSLDADDHPEVVRALATGYFKVGDMLAETGETQAGIDMLKQSLASGETLVEMTGDQTDLVLLINIVSRLGDARSLALDRRGALEDYRRVLALSEIRVSRFPGDNAMMSRGMSYTTLGGALAQAGELDAALEHYARAIEIEESLVEKQPDNALYLRELRLVYNWAGHLLGGAYSINLGDRDAALASYRKALTIAETLSAADPASGYARHDLLVCYENIGDALLATDAAGSADFQRRALALIDELLAISPQEFRFLRRKAVLQRKLGVALAGAGDSGAESRVRASLEQLEALKARYPANSELGPELHSGYVALADLLLAAGARDEAHRYYREAARLAEAESAAAPADLHALWRRARSYERLADYHAATAADAAAWREAQSWYQRSLDTWGEWREHAPSTSFNETRERRVRASKRRSDEALAAL